MLKITNAGIDAIERALAAPEESTQHFLPINVLNVDGGIHGSQIQVGAHSSSQTQLVDWQGLRALLPQVRDALGSLSGDDAAVAKSHVETLEAQSRSPAPSHGIVRESLSSLRTILEGSGGGVGAEGIKEFLV